MERKSYKRGGVVAGIIRIIIALAALAVGVAAILVFIHFEEEHNALGIFMIVVIGIILGLASTIALIRGIKVLIDGYKSMAVVKKGREEWGRVLSLYVAEVFDRSGASISTYNLYFLKFEYTDDEGKLSTSEEQVSLKTYNALKGKETIPIKVYGERAIFDANRLGLEGD